MKQETKRLICGEVQNDTKENLGIALDALTKVFGDEAYTNIELANKAHDLRMEIIPIITEIHAQNKNKQ